MSDQRWEASNRFEERKLSSNEDGWTLAGSSFSSSSPLPRTRGKKVRVEFGSDYDPDRKKARLDKENTDFGKENDDAVAVSDTMEEDEPQPTRVLLETELLSNIMEKHILCPLCKCSVSVTFPSVCIASGVRIDCGDKLCTYREVKKPAAANIPVLGSPLIVRNTDYQANIAYVISFLASGDGGKEAERLLGFLGLPNCTTMEKRSWPNNERRLSPVIQELNDEILHENLTAAVALHYGNRELDHGKRLFDLWLDQVKPGNEQEAILPVEHYPNLVQSADMAWQKRSSGNRYDSNSGFAFAVP